MILQETLPAIPAVVIQYLSRLRPCVLSVATLSIASGVPIRSLSRLCSTAGCASPKRLLLWYKLLLGVRWLADGHPVDWSARSAGFSSGSHLRRQLIAVTGRAPKDIARMPDSPQHIREILACEAGLGR